MARGDHAVVRYRECLKKWEQNGWRIDYKALNGLHGDEAVAIPCPARRDSGNWVLDTVPLFDAAESSAPASHPAQAGEQAGGK